MSVQIPYTEWVDFAVSGSPAFDCGAGEDKLKVTKI